MTAEELAKLDASDDFGDIRGHRSRPQLGARQLRRLRPDRRLNHRLLAPPVSHHQDRPRQEGEVDHRHATKAGRSPSPTSSSRRSTPTANPLPATGSSNHCEGDFDWTWTQHTAWRIDEKSKKGDVSTSPSLTTATAAAWSSRRSARHEVHPSGRLPRERIQDDD